MNDASRKAERVTLSRDFGEFLVELSIALHKHAMYPSSHPVARAAAASVALRAERLLEDRATLAFGVARHQLIIEGVATDPNQPVLRRLAEGLHRHHLGADQRRARRAARGDWLGAARVVGRCPSATVRSAWRLHTDGSNGHTYGFIRSRSISSNSSSDTPVEGGAAGAAGGRAAELWIGLARAAMATDQPGQPAEKISAEPALVARAIDEHQGEAAYDQVIVGYLLQIANELKSASEPKAPPCDDGRPD